MKLKIIVFFWSVSLMLSAQSIQIDSQYELPMKLNKTGQFPVLNEDGTMLLYTNDGYQGLYFYNFETKEEKVISNMQNSGYEPIFSNDNSKIFFRNTSFNQRKRYDALESYDLKTGRQVQMISPRRDLRSARSYHNGALIKADNKLYKTTFGRTKATIPTYVTNENLKIFVYVNGKRYSIDPVSGENINYIWVSLSPDNTKILFTAVGKGTYVSDLNGKILANIGKLNAPVWYDNDFIVGMNDIDNGVVVTSSEVLIMSLDGKIKKQISNQNHIAMYPTASYKSKKIVYSTLEGKLIVSELNIE